MKIAINRAWGGFHLPDALCKLLCEKKGVAFVNPYMPDDIERTDPILIDILETNTTVETSIRVVEIPDSVHWHISDYDGMETVCENHRKWC
jgi:hypothetical protein